jgi:hypothetical protein
MAVGDYTASATASNSRAVHDLIAAQNPDALLGLGDFEYDDIGSILSGWNVMYGPRPGGLYPLTFPTAGPTHDVTSCTDGRYQTYFGRPAERIYSFDIGGWHVVSLPSSAWRYGCNTAALTTALAADLAAHPSLCTLAFTHEPYWTRPTATHTRTTAERPWIQALYDAGADVVLFGHQHDYQRFLPQDPGGNPDPARGITAFVVGTGGIGLYPFTGAAANVAASTGTTYGALELTLRAGSLTWQFKRAAGGAFTDGPGRVVCH